MQRKFYVFCLVILLAPSRLLAAQPDSASSLPDAPSPAPPTRSMIVPAFQATSPAGAPVHYASLYARTIFPGETAQHLTVREKFIYSGRQMIEPVNLLPAVFSAGESQLFNSDPKYGTDSVAFDQRLGAALIREDSDRLFTNAVLPALLHEDPRYYRLGEGSTTMARTENALKQIFIARSDSGQEVPNYAGMIGRGMALGLTQAYYPDTSRGGGVVLRGFSYSLLGLGAYNIMREFVPREVFTYLTIFRHPADAGPNPETK